MEYNTGKTRIIELVPPEEEKSQTFEFTLTADLPRRSNDRYKFIRSIGFGGMKAVLLVSDIDTGREVAMAMMPDFRTRPLHEIELFIREARLTAWLEHPNIVPVHDMGTDMSGVPFFIMKYLRGQSLATLLRRVRRDDPEAVANYEMSDLLQIFTRVCNAVSFAHARGVLHLDIKPNNVNLGDFGEVLLIDWGLAVNLEELRQDNRRPPRLRDGVAKGTPGFMSPEQVTGQNSKLDCRSDIYGLGALLYTMLALQHPLAHQPIEQIMAGTARGDIPPPSRVADGRVIPSAMEAICLKAMALEPADRYASVEELLRDLEAFRHGYAPEAQHASPLRKTALFINRNFLEVFMAALILLLIALLVYATR